MEHQPTGVSTILRTLQRRKAVIALCAILVPLAAFVVSVRQTKEYTAATTLLFREAGFDQKLFGSQSFQRPIDPAREAATNVRLVSLETVSERVESRLGDLGPVEVAAVGESDLVAIKATDPSPSRAANVANTFAQEYTDFRRRADRAKISEARNLVNGRLQSLAPDEREGLQARSLRGRLEQLDILASLQTGNVEVVERAEPPESPSSPQTARNTVLGAVLGILLGLGLALLFDRLDKRLRDPKEMEEIFERPILGAVPESKALSHDRTPVGALDPLESESFRMLRANLRYFNVGRQVQSVLVTSAASGEGKTTVALNLALGASGNSRVLLIEADLRHPGLSARLGHPRGPGLSAVLAGETELEAAVQTIEVAGDATDGGGLVTLDVLLAGPLPPNPTDLLASDRMRDVIARAEQAYDFVVVDTPPTTIVSDAIPLVKMVAGVIVVGRLNKTTRDAAQFLHEQLRNLDAPVLGIVANGVRSRTGPYGYAYGYGPSSQNGGGRWPRVGRRVGSRRREASTSPSR